MFVRHYPEQNPVLRDLLPLITTPTQIVAGRNDDFVPWSNNEYLRDLLLQRDPSVRRRALRLGTGTGRVRSTSSRDWSAAVSARPRRRPITGRSVAHERRGRAGQPTPKSSSMRPSTGLGTGDGHQPARAFSNEFRARPGRRSGDRRAFAGRNWHKAMGEWETVSIVNRFEPMRVRLVRHRR